MVLVAIRLGEDTVLLRNEDETAPTLPHEQIERDLLAKGLQLIDEQTALGDVAAIQTAGIRGAWWDLWGADERHALQLLQGAVLGDDVAPTSMSGPMQDLAAGMTLDELMNDGEGGDGPSPR